MGKDLAIELSNLPVSQLFSELDDSQAELASMSVLYLAQQYGQNPDSINRIPIPVIPAIDSSLSTTHLPAVAQQRRYKVLHNHHIFFARQKARCPFALCLRLNQPDQHPDLWRAELQLTIPSAKPNITTMNREELQQAFAYCIKREKSLTKLLGHGELIQELAKHPGRPYWSSWQPLKDLAKNLKLPTRITKTHTDHLDKYFCLDSQPLAKLCINKASSEELKHQSSIFINRRIAENGKIAEQLAHHLSSCSRRPHWPNAAALLKELELDMETNISFLKEKEIKEILKQGFYFDPILTMTTEQLRREAQQRGLVVKSKLRKAQLVELLCSS